MNADFSNAIRILVGQHSNSLHPYVIDSSRVLLDKLNSDVTFSGITVTSPGFYVPQGRELRLHAKLRGINEKLSGFEYHGLQILNYEMESSAMYALARLLGHEALAICLVIANRINKNTTRNYRDHIKNLIEYVLNKIAVDESTDHLS